MCSIFCTDHPLLFFSSIHFFSTQSYLMCWFFPTLFLELFYRILYRVVYLHQRHNPHFKSFVIKVLRTCIWSHSLCSVLNSVLQWNGFHWIEQGHWLFWCRALSCIYFAIFSFHFISLFHLNSKHMKNCLIQCLSKIFQIQQQCKQWNKTVSKRTSQAYDSHKKWLNVRQSSWPLLKHIFRL